MTARNTPRPHEWRGRNRIRTVLGGRADSPPLIFLTCFSFVWGDGGEGAESVPSNFFFFIFSLPHLPIPPFLEQPLLSHSFAPFLKISTQPPPPFGRGGGGGGGGGGRGADCERACNTKTENGLRIRTNPYYPNLPFASHVFLYSSCS